MSKPRASVKKEQDANYIFRHKIEILKEQIKPYTEYNWDNLVAISKQALKIFTKEEIAGKEENVFALLSFAYYIDQDVVRPHFKIRRNRLLPLGDTFDGVFPTIYCIAYHRDKLIAEQKKHKEALAAYRKKYPERNAK